MDQFLEIAKAITAGIIGSVVAFLSALLPFMVDGQPVTSVGWVTAWIAALVSLSALFGATYVVPNKNFTYNG